MRHLIFAAALLPAVASPALANTFNFSYGNSSVVASGTLSATDEGNGTYLVTGIEGTRNGVAISSLDGADVFGNDDDLITLSSSLLVDFSGLSYSTVGGTQYNLYSSSGSDRETITGFDDGTGVSLTITPTTPTPEPSALMLLGSGTLAAAGAFRRKFAR